jgi:hypothetical protein
VPNADIFNVLPDVVAGNHRKATNIIERTDAGGVYPVLSVQPLVEPGVPCRAAEQPKKAFVLLIAQSDFVPLLLVQHLAELPSEVGVKA